MSKDQYPTEFHGPVDHVEIAQEQGGTDVPLIEYRTPADSDVIRQGLEKFARTADHPLAGTPPKDRSEPARVQDAIERYSAGQTQPSTSNSERSASRPTQHKRKALALLGVTVVLAAGAAGAKTGAIDAVAPQPASQPTEANAEQNAYIEKLAKSGNKIARQTLQDNK